MSIKTIGIIGHRKIRAKDVEHNVDDIPKIKEALREWCKDIYPFLDESVELLSSLACGADQIIAYWLEEPSHFDKDIPKFPPIELVFVEPFKITAARKTYQQIVEEEEGKYSAPVEVSYKKLIGDCSRTETMRNEPIPLKDEEKELEKAYRKAGRYIADHCDVLLVLWDGVENGKVGGTSDTMEYARSQECREKRKDNGPEIHHLVIPQQENPFPVGVPFEFRKYSAAPASPCKRSSLKGRSGKRLTQILILGILAILSVLCGIMGYDYSLHSSFLEGLQKSIPYSVALLVLGNFTKEEFSSWWEILARIFAALFFMLAASTVAMSYLGGELRRWRIARGKHHILVGAGWKGRQLAESIIRSGEKLLIIDKKLPVAIENWCADNKVPTIEGDALEDETWSQAGLRNADTIYIFCGKDQESMEATAVAARALVDHLPKASIKCYAELQSQRNFQVLMNALPEDKKLEVNLLNAEKVTARELIRRYPLDRFEANPEAEISHVIIIGNTSMARAILRHVMDFGIFEPEKRLAIRLFVEDAAHVTQEFLARYPVFKKEKSYSDGSFTLTPKDHWVIQEKILPTIQIHPMTASDDFLLNPEKGLERVFQPDSNPQVISLFVAIDDGNRSVRVSENIAKWLMHHRQDKQCDIQLFCYVATGILEYRRDIHRSLNAVEPDLPVIIFGDFVDDFSEVNVRGDVLDQLAIGICEMYGQKYNPSIQPSEAWSESSENDKNSNRLAASHADLKMRYFRRSAKPGVIDPTIVKELSQMEHRRWCAEYLLRGFRPLVSFPSAREGLLSQVANKIGLYQLSDTDKEKIRRWFSGKKGKDSFRKQKFHLDLMPFHELKPVIDAAFPKNGTGKSKGDEEMDKDEDQVRFILEKNN